MIYEFAIEPDLVATWHDPRVAYPFVSQMGPGYPRVACAFPEAAWKNLVIGSLRELFPDGQSPRWQTAKRNIEVLLRHLHETGTTRTGKVRDGESWFVAVEREHAAYPFGGVLVKSSVARRPFLVVADQLGVEDFAAWTPAAPSVLRQPRELAEALAPLLRCATGLRFVDPYFDAADPTFRDPMREFLSAAQRRRDVNTLQVEIHCGMAHHELEQARRHAGRQLTELEFAEQKIQSCRTHLVPMLAAGVRLRTFVWASLVDRIHNRYILTKLGGVMLGTGLDRSPSGAGHTDDLTLLSKDQHDKRWKQYVGNPSDLRLITQSIISL